MSKLYSKEICNLIDELIGATVPVGETNADYKRLGNLMTLIDVTNWCLDGVREVAECNGYEASVIKARETARGALMEWSDWLKDVLEE